MTEVQIRGFDAEDNDDVQLGRILWDGTSLSIEPDDQRMRTVAAARVPPGVTAAEDPEAFLEGLHKHYKSAYLRATKPREIHA